MIRSARDLSADQKLLIEELLGRPISEEEQISIRAITPPSAPEWLERSWDSAERLGLDQISMDEIDSEIAAARRDRRLRPSGQ